MKGQGREWWKKENVFADIGLEQGCLTGQKTFKENINETAAIRWWCTECHYGGMDHESTCNEKGSYPSPAILSLLEVLEAVGKPHCVLKNPLYKGRA